MKNNLSKEIEDINKNQIRILKLKNIITNIKKMSGWAKQQNGMAEEEIFEFEDRTIETTQSKQHRGKKEMVSETFGAMTKDLTFMSPESQKERRKRQD